MRLGRRGWRICGSGAQAAAFGRGHPDGIARSKLRGVSQDGGPGPISISSFADEAPWRFRLQSAIGLFVAILLTGAGVVLIYFDSHNNAEVKAYLSSASCTTPAAALAGESCRYTGTATVTGSTGQPVISIDVTFSELPGHTFTSTFSDIDEPSAETVFTGATETAELWNGHLTRFANVTTLDNPEKLPLHLALGGWIIAVFGLVLATVCIVYARRAWHS